MEVREQVQLLESLQKEKKYELKRIEAVDREKDRLFAAVIGMGLTVDEAIGRLRESTLTTDRIEDKAK